MSAITNDWKPKHSHKTALESAERRVQRGWAKIKYARERGLEWMNTTHDFCMKYGDGFIGPIISMTGREAKARNKLLDGKFWKALNTNKGARLGRWVWIKPEQNHED